MASFGSLVNGTDDIGSSSGGGGGSSSGGINSSNSNSSNSEQQPHHIPMIITSNLSSSSMNSNSDGGGTSTPSTPPSIASPTATASAATSPTLTTSGNNHHFFSFAFNNKNTLQQHQYNGFYLQHLELQLREETMKRMERELSEKEMRIQIRENKMKNMFMRIERMIKSQPIKLNVGGVLFETTVDTLTHEKDTFFSAIMSQRFDVQRDNHGILFIDRNPKWFYLILDHMRGIDVRGRIAILSPQERDELAEEVDFYQIGSMFRFFPDYIHMDSFDQCSPPVPESMLRSFVARYYTTFKIDRKQLAQFYHDNSILIWEGEKCIGKEAIMKKFTSLPFLQIMHHVITLDSLPTDGEHMLLMLTGEMTVDNNIALIQFTDTFTLQVCPGIEPILKIVQQIIRLQLP
jgi:hypothetical protein